MLFTLSALLMGFIICMEHPSAAPRTIRPPEHIVIWSQGHEDSYRLKYPALWDFNPSFLWTFFENYPPAFDVTLLDTVDVKLCEGWKSLLVQANRMHGAGERFRIMVDSHHNAYVFGLPGSDEAFSAVAEQSCRSIESPEAALKEVELYLSHEGFVGHNVVIENANDVQKVQDYGAHHLTEADRQHLVELALSLEDTIHRATTEPVSDGYRVRLFTWSAWTLRFYRVDAMVRRAGEIAVDKVSLGGIDGHR